MNVIWSLCRKYTDLSDEEIRIIEHMSETLQPLANLEGADIFIDCPGRDGNAIVVAEAKPECVPSSYKNTVVGLLAKPENEPAVARTFRLGVGTKQMKAVTQENGSTIQSVEPIRNGSHIIGVLILEKRVDEQRQVSERIHFSQQSFETIAHALAQMVPENNWLTECIDEALLMVDRSGIVTFRNSLAQDLYRRLGYIEDILGQPYENVRLVEQDGNSEECSGYSYVETTVSNLVLDIKHIQLNSAGAAFAVIIQDVTWRREQEQALILKSVAIKEIHHRVKNNLQTIASLLRLQTRRTDSEETRQVLGESMNRILSIASTHELLAQSGVDEVMLGEVILNIKNNTMRYFSNPKCLCHHYHGGRGLSGGLRHRHVGGHHHQRTASELPEVRLPGPLFRRDSDRRGAGEAVLQHPGQRQRRRIRCGQYGGQPPGAVHRADVGEGQAAGQPGDRVGPRGNLRQIRL